MLYEYLTITTLLVVGAIAGVTELRDAYNEEFSEIAAAVVSLDQSFDAGNQGRFIDP